MAGCITTTMDGVTPIGTPDTPEEQLPATDQYDLPGVPVANEDGNVLLQQEDGTYLFLQANSEVPKRCTLCR